MPGTFAEFVTWPDREEIMLAEIQALLTLTGWVGTGGFGNTYQVAVANRTTPPTGLAPLYRRVTGVRENGTDLTAQTSISNVNSTAGSWFWDEATGTLYVRTTGAAVDPDTKTVIAARVTFPVATTGIVLNRVDGDPSTGVYYAPWLAPAGGPTSVQEVDDVLTGQKTAWGGECVLTNGHGAWHAVVAPESGYTWKHQRITFRLGGRYRGQELALSEFAIVATMLIEDVVADESTCRFALTPRVGQVESAVPVTPYFESEYPRLGEGVRGTYKAILYGRAWTVPALTDTDGYGTWTIADAAYQNLHRVHAVEAVRKSDGLRSVLSEGQDYTVNLTACTVTLLTDRFPFTDFTLTVDATGKTNAHAEAGGGAGMRGYLSTFAEIARDLLHSFAGATAADVDAAGFADAHADARQELAVYLPSPRALTSILSTNEEGFASLERSVNGVVLQTRAGLWTARVWDPTYDATTLPALRKEDLAAFSPSPRLERFQTATRVHYAADARYGTWSQVSRATEAAQLLTGVLDELQVFTFLRNDGDAETMAGRYRLVQQHAVVDVDFLERGSILALVDVGARALVTYSPAPHTSGAYTARAFELVRVERGYAPRMTIRGQMRDVGRVTNRCGRWKGSAAPNYAGASAAQRLLSGFWGGASPSSALGWA
jgi:hypothetical protein